MENVSDFPELQLAYSGEWKMHTGTENRVGSEAGVCKQVLPASNCLGSRRFAQHED